MRPPEIIANLSDVPNLGGKKEVVIGSKVSQAVYDALTEIAENQDRTISYLVREFMMRGLAHHFADGEIRSTSEEDAWLLAGPTNKLTEIRHYGKLTDERAPQKKRKKVG